MSSTAFRDANRNGKLDVGEQKLLAPKIFLDKNGNNAWDAGEVSVLTNATGFYKFAGLIGKSYRVAIVRKSGWAKTAPSSSAYVLDVSGANLTGYNFGHV